MVISGLSIEAMTFGAGNICHWFKLVEKNVEEIIFSTAGGSKKNPLTWEIITVNLVKDFDKAWHFPATSALVIIKTGNLRTNVINFRWCV